MFNILVLDIRFIQFNSIVSFFLLYFCIIASAFSSAQLPTPFSGSSKLSEILI